MAQASQFQVTLPSNSSVTYFPNNRPYDFTTKLAVPLDLDGEWEVGVIDIQYPLTWKTIEKDIRVGLLSRGSGFYKGKNDVFDQQIYWAEFSPHTVNLEHTSLPPEQWLYPCAYGSFTLKAAYYKSVNQLLDRLNSKMSEVYKLMGSGVGAPPHLTYDEEEDRVIGEALAFPLTFYTDSPVLNELLGVPPFAPKDGMYRILYDGELNTTLPPELDTRRSFYIYTNIIEIQRCGDVQAPLLGVIPVKGNYREQVLWSFMPQNYLPLAQRHIETINIKLCTDTGEKLAICGNGKVIVRLQFRRRNNLV